MQISEIFAECVQSRENEESKEAYTILSKGYIEQIEKIRREIDEYLGFLEIEYREPAVVAYKWVLSIFSKYQL